MAETMSDTWEVFAIRYATADLAGNHLGLETDFHDQPGKLDYFIWLVRNETQVVLVDTGFDLKEGQRRGRVMIEDPKVGLRSLGVETEDITDIVISHMHYDHAGNLGGYPNARFHLQDREMAYATGRCMCHERMRRPFSVDDVVDTVRLVYEERVVFHEGDYTLFPGLDVFLVGGHSKGLQVVRANTCDSNVVVASDALHLGRYLDDHDVFPLFVDYFDVLEGYGHLKKLAGPDGTILPGHDPEVIKRFPAVKADLPNIVRIQ